MTDVTPATPIVVPATPASDQLASGLRSVILGLGVIATTLGATKFAGTLNGLLEAAGPIAAVVSVVWSQWNAHSQHAQKVTMANAAPDSVAVVK